MAEAIRAVGAEIVYMPPYSPDKYPIELAFSKVRGEIRKRAPRTKPECDQCCGESLDWFAKEECLNYIAHAGYVV